MDDYSAGQADGSDRLGGVDEAAATAGGGEERGSGKCHRGGVTQKAETHIFSQSNQTHVT